MFTRLVQFRTISEKLPSSDALSSIQKPKTLAIERIFHTIKDQQQRIFSVGPRPGNDVNPKPSSRLRRRSKKGGVANVMAVARQYQTYLSKPKVVGFKQVAEHFGVTKATVSYYLSFLNRLPVDFVDWLEACSHPMVLTFFGQKRLREIVTMEDAEKGRAIVVEARKLAAELDGDGDQTVDVNRLIQIVEKNQEPRPLRREQRSIMLD